MKNYVIEKRFDSFIVTGSFDIEGFYIPLVYQVLHSDRTIQSIADDFMYIVFEMEYKARFSMDGNEYRVYSYHDTDDIIVIKMSAFHFLPVCGDYKVPGLENISNHDTMVI